MIVLKRGGLETLKAGKVGTWGSSCFFPGSKATRLLVRLALYRYVYHPTSLKGTVAELLLLKEVITLDYSILLGNEYLYHEKCGWRGSSTL